VNLEDYHQNGRSNAMPMKNPPHSGDFIRTEIIQPAGLSVTAAAALLHVSRPALSSLLNGIAHRPASAGAKSALDVFNRLPTFTREGRE